jgi:vanillate O-demethylase monooxygenase subunit
VKRYPAVERAEWVWVWMGAPDTADPATIPPYRWFVQPGWRSRIGYLHVNCSYRLIVDNLLNMAHLPFVHGGTIGSEGVVKDAKVSVQRDGERVRLARRMYDIEPPPTYKQARGFEGKVSRWQIIDFAAPGYFEFDTGLIDAGHEIPDISPDRPLPSNARILSRHAMHGVAPESAASTHYYFGFTYDPADHTEQMADFLFDGMLKTFIEDVEVLEAQQANMALTPGAHVIDIVSDTAGLQATRIIDEIERRN